MALTSSNLLIQVGFQTRKSDVLALYSCFNFLPVSILPKNGDCVYVINTEIWKNVSLQYFESRKVVEMDHRFDYLEKSFSVRELVESVDIVASPSEIQIHCLDGLLIKSAVSRLIVMVSYSAFFTEFREFFQYVFDDGIVKIEEGGGVCMEEWEESIQLYDTLIVLAKSWKRLSKDVYENKAEFELNDQMVSFDDLSAFLTLANSKKEDWCYLPEQKLDVDFDYDTLQISKVISLRRDARHKNLCVKVMSFGKVLFENGYSAVTGDKSSISNFRMSEFLVGDSTGCIMFLARNDQVDALRPGLVVMLKNARTEFYYQLHLSVKEGEGKIEIVDNPGDFTVREDKLVY